MENTIYVYAKMIQACLNIGDLVKAIETAELSKTRNLVELITHRDLRTIYPSEVASKLEKLQSEINAGQYHKFIVTLNVKNKVIFFIQSS